MRGTGRGPADTTGSVLHPRPRHSRGVFALRGCGAIPAGEGQLRARGENDPCSRLAENRRGSPGIAETPAGLEGAGCYVLRAAEVRWQARGGEGWWRWW